MGLESREITELQVYFSQLERYNYWYNYLLLMRVSEPRWGEITVKKQAGAKNHFGGTKSFSVVNAVHEYSLVQIKQILEEVVNLTQFYDSSRLLALLRRMGREVEEK